VGRVVRGSQNFVNFVTFSNDDNMKFLQKEKKTIAVQRFTSIKLALIPNTTAYSWHRQINENTSHHWKADTRL